MVGVRHNEVWFESRMNKKGFANLLQILGILSIQQWQGDCLMHRRRLQHQPRRLILFLFLILLCILECESQCLVFEMFIQVPCELFGLDVHHDTVFIFALTDFYVV